MTFNLASRRQWANWERGAGERVKGRKGESCRERVTIHSRFQQYTFVYRTHTTKRLVCLRLCVPPLSLSLELSVLFSSHITCNWQSAASAIPAKNRASGAQELRAKCVYVCALMRICVLPMCVFACVSVCALRFGKLVCLCVRLCVCVCVHMPRASSMCVCLSICFCSEV